MLRFGTQLAQTSKPASDSVAAEGGGWLPTLGGGTRARVPEGAGA
jgi:hypothetical protein